MYLPINMTMQDATATQWCPGMLQAQPHSDHHCQLLMQTRAAANILDLYHQCPSDSQGIAWLFHLILL